VVEPMTLVVVLIGFERAVKSVVGCFE